MASTQCLAVARWLPTGNPVAMDGVQVASTPPVTTRFVKVGDEATNLISALGVPTDAHGRTGDFYVDLDNGQLYGPKQGTAPMWSPVNSGPLPLPTPTEEGQVLQADAALSLVPDFLDGGTF